MSVKKLLVLAAAGIAMLGATAAMAGGPDVMPPAVDYSGVYVQLNAGYAYSNYRNSVLFDSVVVLAGSTVGTVTGFGNGDTGGFTFGADIGYQWNQYLAAELGWFYLPRADGNVVGTLATGGVFNTGWHVNNWFAYLALKGMIPVWDNFDLFAKFGVAYRRARFSFNGASTNSNIWTPIFGVGIAYHFDENWAVKFQYLYVPGYGRFSSNRFPVPPANVFTLGVDYKFAV